MSLHRILRVSTAGVAILASAAVATNAQRGAPPPATPATPAAPLPVLNRDTMPVLILPVVIHLGGSKAFTSGTQLRGIVAEMQRIYDQAKIELRPSFVADTLATDSLDVYFQPSVSTAPGTNGITYPRNARECFVRDTVHLRHVDDQRPERIAVPAYLRSPSASPADSLMVSAYEASQARTATHEMGHALGLPHRQDTTNLEASGTTGWTLNSAEILTVRQTATRKFMAKPR